MIGDVPTQNRFFPKLDSNLGEKMDEGWRFSEENFEQQSLYKYIMPA